MVAQNFSIIAQLGFYRPGLYIRAFQEHSYEKFDQNSHFVKFLKFSSVAWELFVALSNNF